MTRRSITEEARKRQAERPDSNAEAGDDDTGNDDSPEENAERRRFTQRMPEPLVDDIDEFADRHGMSRNAAINLLAKTGLESF